jgi:uncharacterized LabA/DUF88 family protein
MKTACAYVDGFNLYYGIVGDSKPGAAKKARRKKYRWLDIAALCREALPQYDVQKIRYFTAHVLPSKSSPRGLQNQLTYLRALRTTPNLEVHLGSFLEKDTMGMELDQATGQPTGRLVFVRQREEKGSDVNLGAYLVFDACRAGFDAAVVISGDSDLADAIRLVRDEIGKEVCVLNPRQRRSFTLQQAASSYYEIFPRSLRRSQFPDTLVDANGTISKPANW